MHHITSIRTTLIVFALALISGGVLGIPKETAYAVEATPAFNTSPYTPYQVVKATNKARRAKNLDSLTLNPFLSLAAQWKASDMVTNGYFAHITPTGRHYSDFILDTGYSYMNAGENLAFRQKNTSTLIKAWLTSSGHRANILGKQYTDIGVGMAYGERNGQKGWYVVELFGSKLPTQLFSLK